MRRTHDPFHTTPHMELWALRSNTKPLWFLELAKFSLPFMLAAPPSGLFPALLWPQLPHGQDQFTWLAPSNLVDRPRFPFFRATALTTPLWLIKCFFPPCSS